MNDGLTRTYTATSEKLSSMESTVSILHNRVEQIDTRLDKVCSHAYFLQDILLFICAFRWLRHSTG